MNGSRHRQESLARIRSKLPSGRYEKRSALGVAMVIGLFTAHCVILAAAILADHWWLKVLLAASAGLVTGVLFVIGHDASHGSLCHSVAGNRWLARLAFLPSAHPNETWDSEHNRQHHSWTNLSTKDPGYPPMTLDQFRALSPIARLWHRAGYALPLIGLSYLSIWWRSQIRIYRPRIGMVRSKWAYGLEVLSIAIFFVFQTVVVWSFGRWSETGAVLSFVLESLICIGLPFFVWNTTMAFVTIQHHTHPKVRWFDDEREWSVFSGQVQGTVHVTWPRWFELAFLNIFEHAAHHADKQTPLYNLRPTHQALKDAYPGAITVQAGSLRNLLDVLATCRLYDYREHRWMDWDGRCTSSPRDEVRGEFA